MEENNYSNNNVCINYSSDVSLNSGHDTNCNDSNNNTKPTSTKCILTESISAVHLLPIEGGIFHWAFTEGHFMINLCNVCEEANAPLNLVDKVVAVIHDTQNNGLNMESNIEHSREYFFKHLNKGFTSYRIS